MFEILASIKLIFSERSKEIYDLESGKQLWNVDSGAMRGVFSPDGLLLGVGYFHEIHVWDVPRRKKEKTLKVDEPFTVERMAFSPDSKLLAVSASQGLVKIVELESGAERKCPVAKDSINMIAFVPQGNVLISANVNGGGKLQYWDVKTCKEKKVASDLSGGSFQVSPGGLLVATSGLFGGGQVRVWALPQFD